ncbi:MAG TPA: porin [Methylocystis sp.]|nr:porin [Methylocystis sp.]
MRIGVGIRALAAAAFGVVAMLPASQAGASNEKEEIRALIARLKKLEAKVAEQERQEKQTRATAQHATNVANAANAAIVKGELPPPPPPVFVTFKNGLKVETADGDFSFKIGGRIFVDGGVNTLPVQTFPATGWTLPSSIATFDPSHSANGFSNQVGFRQARLEVEGKAWRDWYYKFQYDFAGAPNDLVLGGFRDAWLAYGGLKPITFQVGNQFEPSSLERTNSSKTRDFIERAQPSDLLAGNRHLGFAAAAGGYAPGFLGKPNWSAKAGVYSTSLEDGNPQGTTTASVGGTTVVTNIGVPAGNSGFLNPVAGGHQYWDAAGRVTYAPILTPEALLHIGGSFRFQKPNDATAASDDRVLQPGSTLKSEANILNENLLGTPALTCVSPLTQVVGGNCVQSVLNPGAELVGAYGPFSVQAEYLGVHYNRSGSLLTYYNLGGQHAPGSTSVNFSGYYVYGTWYLTGESRAEAYLTAPDEFNAPSTFGQIKILHPLSQGGWGAWELATRLSEINLNDGGTGYLQPLGSRNNIQGGRQTDVTVGLNWYPDRGIRFMANWVNVVQYAAPYTRPDINGIHPQLFELRAQVDW